MSQDPVNIYEHEANKLDAENKRLKSFTLPNDMSIKAIGSIQPGTRFLDVGAGPNTFLLDYVRSAGGIYTALDKNPEFLKQQKVAGAKVVKADIRKLGLPSNAFDIAHARFVIAHMGADKQKSIREIVRVVKSKGRAIFIDYDWSTARGSKAFNEVKDFMINGGFLFDADFGSILERTVRDSKVSGSLKVYTFSPVHMLDYSKILNLQQAGIADLIQQGKDNLIDSWQAALKVLESEAKSPDPPGYFCPGADIVILTKD
ncbi:MAG: class I SAM-dependent methyltransferase [Candidatus Saccharimonadales bacterium]